MDAKLRLAALLAALLAVIAVAACSDDDEDIEDTNPAVRGVIVEKTDADQRGGTLGTILVHGEVEPDTAHDRALITITADTDLNRRDGPQPLAFAGLHVGDTVEAWFTGPVLDSYPVQATAARIVLLAEAAHPTPDPEDDPSIRGMIVTKEDAPGEGDILGTLLVYGDEDTGLDYDTAYVRITSETLVRGVDGAPADWDSLAVADVIEVWFTGPVAESYPVQATAGLISVLAIEPPPLRGEPSIHGEIESVSGNTIRVRGEPATELQYDYADITVLGPNYRLHDGQYHEAAFEDLAQGATVEAWFVGPALLSYPVQVGSAQIVILE
jgi:hypothetical protein